jgi:LysM repeat protein
MKNVFLVPYICTSYKVNTKQKTYKYLTPMKTMGISSISKGLVLLILAGGLSMHAMAQTKENAEYKGSQTETPYMKYARERDEKRFGSAKKTIESKTSQQKDTSNKQTQYPLKKDSSKKEEIQEYTIKSGDTFYNIAEKFYGTGKDDYWIQKANPKVDPSKLKVGQKILIPKR